MISLFRRFNSSNETQHNRSVTLPYVFQPVAGQPKQLVTVTLTCVRDENDDIEGMHIVLDKQIDGDVGNVINWEYNTNDGACAKHRQV